MFKSEHFKSVPNVHFKSVPNVQKIIEGEKNLEKVSCN